MNNLAVVHIFGQTAVDGMAIQVQRNDLILRDIEGIIFETVIQSAKHTVLGIPIGIKGNRNACDPVFYFDILHCILPAEIKALVGSKVVDVQGYADLNIIRGKVGILDSHIICIIEIGITKVAIDKSHLVKIAAEGANRITVVIFISIIVIERTVCKVAGTLVNAIRRSIHDAGVVISKFRIAINSERIVASGKYNIRMVIVFKYRAEEEHRGFVKIKQVIAIVVNKVGFTKMKLGILSTNDRTLGIVSVKGTVFNHELALVSINCRTISVRYRVILKATAVYGKLRSTVHIDTCTVVIMHFVANDVHVVQRYVRAALDVETATLAVAVATGNSTVVNNNVGIIIDKDNLTVVLRFGQTTVNRVPIEVEGYFHILGDIDRVVVKSSAVDKIVGELAVFVGIPIGVKINYDTLVY